MVIHIRPRDLLAISAAAALLIASFRVTSLTGLSESVTATQAVTKYLDKATAEEDAESKKSNDFLSFFSFLAPITEGFR
jgi:hypothetical protein